MSTLKADTIQNTSGGAVTLTKQHAAKAWCNFNGTGTVAVRDSFNEASLTDNGTGNYTIAFTNSMGNSNYSVAYKAGNTFDGANSTREIESPTLSTSSMQLYSGTTSTAVVDIANYHSQVHGDLA